MAILLVAIGAYLRYRKRKKWLDENPIERRLRRQSSLSFRCQTHLTPKTPSFPIGQEEVATVPEKEKAHLYPAEPMYSQPPASSPEMASWTYQDQQQYHALSVETSHLPSMPPKVHSPRQKQSPADDYHKTPTSTISARSTTPLLPSIQPYVPADYVVPNSAVTPSPRSSPRPRATATLSPFATPPVPLHDGSWPLPGDVQDYSPVVEQPKHGRVIDVLLGVEAAPVAAAAPPQQRRALAALSSSPSSLKGGSPVESRTLQTSFPPPPRAGWRR